MPEEQNVNETYLGVLSGYLRTQRMKQAAHLVISNDRILDLACNDGRLLEMLPHNISYVGIDIQEYAIKQAQTRYPQHQFIVADLTQAPNIEQQQFDVIIMLAFLEHIKNPAQLLQMYSNYLAPNGQIIITTPAPYGRRLHDWGAKIGLFSKEAAEEHEAFLDKQVLSEIASQANLGLITYKRFLFGFNQLACFAHRSV